MSTDAHVVSLGNPSRPKDPSCRRLALVLGGVATCVTMAAAPLGAQALQLERLVEYGWDDVSQGSGALTPRQRALDGGSLASVAGAVEGGDGRVYVLDMTAPKVAVFEADGRFHDAVGGSGEGPGEFRMPGRLTTDESGAVYVWDRRLSRITRVDVFEGRPWTLVVQSSGLVDFAVSRDTAWFTRMVVRPGAAAVGVSMKTGSPVDSFARLGAEEVGLSAFGAPGSIAAGGDGSVIFAGPFPAQVRIRGRNQDRPIGINRYPDARGFEDSRGTRDTPISMRDAAIADDGRIAVLYTERVPGTDGGLVNRPWLEILGRDGRSLGRTRVEADGVHAVSWTRNGELLVSVTDTYPRVWRMRIVPAR